MIMITIIALMLTMVDMVMDVVMVVAGWVDRSIPQVGRSVIGRLFFRFIGRFQGLVGRLSVDFAPVVRST